MGTCEDNTRTAKAQTDFWFRIGGRTSTHFINKKTESQNLLVISRLLGESIRGWKQFMTNEKHFYYLIVLQPRLLTDTPTAASRDVLGAGTYDGLRYHEQGVQELLI